MTIQLYLKRPKATEYTAIYARIRYEDGELKYYLPEQIQPNFWSPKEHRARSTRQFPEYPEFNARLDTCEQLIKTTYRKYINDNGGRIPSPATLKCCLDVVFGKTENRVRSFMEYFEEFIKRSGNGERISPKTKKATVENTNKGYTTTFNHLKAFLSTYRRNIDFETVDLEFYNDYLRFLTHTVQLQPNTMGDHIKRIKTILREARARGIKVNPAFESEYFAKPAEETDSIYLTVRELELLEALDLSKNSKLERVRDLFLVGCYTGLRYSDYSALTPEHVRDGFIYIKQAKTGKDVVIPVHPRVRVIMSKYGGELPEKISNQKTNEYLKEVGKMVPELEVSITSSYTQAGQKKTIISSKWSLITTHTARRSFATNEYLAGTPAVTIMAITGHRTEKAFLRYIKLSSADHAKLLKVHWENRTILKAV